jgi:hypothetical protein
MNRDLIADANWRRNLMKPSSGLWKDWLDIAISSLRPMVAVCIASFFAAPASGNDQVLENPSTRLVLKDNRIVSLFDKVRSIEHISPRAETAPGLFRIHLVKGMQPAMDIDAVQTVSRVLRKAANELELEFESPHATVRARVALSGAPGETLWTISVVPSDNDLRTGSVAYPVFATPVSADGAVKDCLLPLYEGRLHPIDVGMVDHKPKVYPATLFSQMVACLGPKGGLLLWCDDTAGHVKEFKYSAAKTEAQFSVIHRMPYEPGAWKAPYQTRISFSGPSWYDAADIYRDWASGQHWCRSKLKDRKDMPAFLLDPHFHATVQLGKEEDLASVPDQLNELGDRLNAPIIVRGTYWEKHGGWVGIDYFPPSIGEEGLRSFAASLKARNIRLICEIAGYRWLRGDEKSVVLNQINRLPPEKKDELVEFFDDNGGPSVCEMSRDGRLNPSTTICRGSPFGKNFLQDMARRLFDLGLTTFHCDSDVGPSPDGVSGCFNTAHGHPVPCGPWSTENTRDAFRAIRAEAARRGIGDFFLMKEHCSELLNMEIHAYLSRMGQAYTEPHVVPLTQYLYHEYLPIVLYNAFPVELNDIIAYGQIPGGSPLLEKVPALNDYYRSMRVHAKDFLLYGRMRRPLIPEVPARKTTTAGKMGRATTEIAVPIVRQSAWDDGAGNIGVFAINTGEQEIRVDVPTPAGGSWRATYYIGESEQSTRAVAPGEKLGWNLPPGRLAAIVLKPSGSGDK